MSNKQLNKWALNIGMIAASVIVISILIGSGELLMLALASVFIVPYVLVMADVIGGRTIRRKNEETYQFVSLLVSGILYLLIVIGLFAEAYTLVIVAAFLIFVFPFFLNVFWPKQ